MPGGLGAWGSGETGGLGAWGDEALDESQVGRWRIENLRVQLRALCCVSVSLEGAGLQHSRSSPSFYWLALSMAGPQPGPAGGGWASRAVAPSLEVSAHGAQIPKGLPKGRGPGVPTEAAGVGLRGGAGKLPGLEPGRAGGEGAGHAQGPRCVKAQLWPP